MPKIKVKGQTVQTGERPQTDGRAHSHGRYQTYYLPCYAVDKHTREYPSYKDNRSAVRAVRPLLAGLLYSCMVMSG